MAAGIDARLSSRRLVFACSATLPEATTVVVSSAPRRASSASTGVTRAGMPPCESMRA